MLDALFQLEAAAMQNRFCVTVWLLDPFENEFKCRLESN
jgi:hypothetical protein